MIEWSGGDPDGCIMKTVIKILKDVRKRTPLLIKDMCALLHLKSWGTLSRVEAGKQVPSWEIILAYHLLLDIPIEELVKQDRERLKKVLRERINVHVNSLLPEARNPEVHERINYLSEIYERLKN